MTAVTHYDLIGVPTDATQADITSAYRKLARKLHPDVNPNADPAELAAISDAYAVLSRPSSRAAYDADLGLDPQPASPAPGTTPDVAAAVPEQPAATPTLRQDGLDVHTQASVLAAEALAGVEVFVPVTFSQPCRPCRATGFDAATLNRICPSCSGVKMHPVTGEKCVFCGGVGSVSDYACPACGGNRETTVHEQLIAKIPPGAVNGTVVRLTRKGATSADGRTRGNVYVTAYISDAPTHTPAPTPDPAPPAPTPGPAAPPASAASAAPGDRVAQFGTAATDFLTAPNGVDAGLNVSLSYPDLRLGTTLVIADPTGAVHARRTCRLASR